MQTRAMPVSAIILAIYNRQNVVSGEALPVEEEQMTCCAITSQFVSLCAPNKHFGYVITTNDSV